MHILSLFDGLSSGQIALERANIPISTYYASEIDKYCIQVTQTNYPNTIQLGDIGDWVKWDIPWKKIDLILAGSPCQGFSFAGKQLSFNDPRSQLFFVFVDILKWVQMENPEVKFLLENVVMKKEYKQIITNYLGVESVLINSALVSAQNRKRLYWANFPITQPEDKCIFWKDISEYGYPNESECVAAMRARYVDGSKKTRQYIEFRYDGKSNALTTVKKNNIVVPFTLPHRIPKEDFIFRYLTPIEYERLQTVPDDFTASVSKTQRYKMLGNGWNIDTIAHILRGLK